MATAFSTQGATPFANPLANAPSNPANPLGGSTPASKALNGAQAPNFQTISGQNQYVAPYKPPAPPAPTTPVKKTTVNNIDGSSHVTEYHAPATAGLLTSSTGDKPNPEYVPGSIGPGNTPTISSTQGAPGSSTNGGAVTQANDLPNLPVQQNSSASLVSSPSNNTYPGLINSAANSAIGNVGIGQNAADIAKNYAGGIQSALTQGANAAAGDLSTGTNVVGEGNAAIASQNASQRATALATAEEAALQGTGQQLTAQNQQTTGLLGAGGLAAPITPSYSSQVINPQNGESLGGTGGALQTAVSNAINQIKAGGGYNAAAATLSSFGPAGTNALLTALGPNFNINANNAQAAAQAANIGTQQTLNTNIGAQGAQQATQNYIAAKTSYDTASQQATNLQNTLATTGINNNPQFVNQKINALQNQLGSANYASFITALNETKQAYTSLLSSVGASTPTVNGQQATDIFNANSTPAQINAAIDALNTASYAKLKPLYDQIGTYSNIGSSGSSSSGTVSAGGYNFVKNAQGQWVAQ